MKSIYHLILDLKLKPTISAKEKLEIQRLQQLADNQMPTEQKQFV